MDSKQQEQMRAALLPCPFCGGAGQFDQKSWGGREYHGVFCTGDCGIFLDTRAKTYSDAAATWNTRDAITYAPEWLDISKVIDVATSAHAEQLKQKDDYIDTLQDEYNERSRECALVESKLELEEEENAELCLQVKQLQDQNAQIFNTALAEQKRLQDRIAELEHLRCPRCGEKTKDKGVWGLQACTKCGWDQDYDEEQFERVKLPPEDEAVKIMAVAIAEAPKARDYFFTHSGNIRPIEVNSHKNMATAAYRALKQMMGGKK